METCIPPQLFCVSLLDHAQDRLKNTGIDCQVNLSEKLHRFAQTFSHFVLDADLF